MDAGIPLHVEVHGGKPAPGRDTYVLLHGYGASGFTWRHWTPHLATRGCVVQVDLKGFGRSPKPLDGRYAPADLAESVHATLRERDLTDVTLVGHSLGGGVALLTALAVADAGEARVRRLVLIASVAYRQRLPPFVYMARWPRLTAALLRLVGTRRLVAAVLRSVVHDRATVSSAQIDGYAAPLEPPGAVAALLASARQIVPPDLDAIAGRYPEVDLPTLLVWGRQDRVVPLAVGERLAESLPDGRLHVIDRCGHLPHEEAPRASLAILDDFLASTARTA